MIRPLIDRLAEAIKIYVVRRDVVDAWKREDAADNSFHCEEGTLQRLEAYEAYEKACQKLKDLLDQAEKEGT